MAILPNATATRLIFSTASGPSGLNVTAIEWATARGAPTSRVSVNKEAIIAGGTIGSPHFIMHCGVGPKDVLDAAGVPVSSLLLRSSLAHQSHANTDVNLPGVGQYLQDHLVSVPTFPSIFYYSFAAILEHTSRFQDDFRDCGINKRDISDL